MRKSDINWDEDLLGLEEDGYSAKGRERDVEADGMEPWEAAWWQGAEDAGYNDDDLEWDDLN